MTSKRFSAAVLVMLAALAAASVASAQTTGQTQADADALALFRAKQAANQAAADANAAAAKAGQAAGLQGAKKDSLSDQFKMVNDAVRNWKQPRGYSSSASVNVSALQDPFARATPAAASASASVVAALGTSGLVWDAERRIARVGTSGQQLCDGRLTAGDYPALPDAALLDTPARITQFLATCADRSTPLMVVVASGDIEVRK
jgi:hypothetical protein